MNRLLEHELIGSAVRSPSAGEHEVGDFWELGPVVRVKDAARVPLGWHLSAFEMLAAVRFGALEDRRAFLHELCADTIGFLTRDIGLDVTRLEVTCFGGGEALPGCSMPPDVMWRQEWGEAGLPNESVTMIEGPLLFLLMTGPSERAGSTCEILYHLGDGRRAEIGTAIAHEWLDESSETGYCLAEATCGAYGVAFGLERLAALMSGRTSLLDEEHFSAGLDLVWSASPHPARARRLLTADAVSLVDLIRLGVILAAFPQPGVSTIALPVRYQRRLVRKAAVLRIPRLADVIASVGDCVVNDISIRHPQALRSAAETLARETAIPWPRCWNPDGYSASSSERD